MKPTKVDLNGYQKIVEMYHKESDRAAAILAGSFVENYLVEFLKTCCFISDPEIDELFDGFGPMASFSQRISIGYAIGALDKGMRDSLRAINQIRNHFAHHPGEAEFGDAILDKHFKKLSVSYNSQFAPEDREPLIDKRRLYLLSIAMFFVRAYRAIENKKQGSNKPS